MKPAAPVTRIIASPGRARPPSEYEPSWRSGYKDVRVRRLASAVSEVTDLDQAFLDQRPQAVVGFPQADPELVGELALGRLRVLRHVLEGAVADFLSRFVRHMAFNC